MNAPTLAIRGRLARSVYPEREDKNVSAPDQFALGVVARLRRLLTPSAAREVNKLHAALDAQGARLRALSDADLLQALRLSAAPAVHAGHRAAARGAAAGGRGRTSHAGPAAHMPRSWSAPPRCCAAAWPRMQTGEGKTLTAGLAACVAALAGVPVHVVTVKRLPGAARRRQAAPAGALGVLERGRACRRPGPRRQARRLRQRHLLLHNKDLVFDYLRDRVATGGRASEAVRARQLVRDAPPRALLRGLHGHRRRGRQHPHRRGARR